MAKGEYNLGDIYQGGYSSFNPSYGSVFSGYHINAGRLGMSTDARTANILKDISKNLSAGAKNVELTQVSPEVFESIPQQHLKELNRLSKLTGVDISVHAPIVEPSGISKDGFSETNREATERQMKMAVERSHEINPNGNIPVTFHSSAGIPGTIIPRGEKYPEQVIIVNAERGSIHPFPIKRRTFPLEEEPSIPAEISKINQEQWEEGIKNLAYYANFGDKELRENELMKRAAEKTGKIPTEAEKEAGAAFQRGSSFLNDSYRQLQGLFEIANKYGSDSDKDLLREYSDKITPKVSVIKKTEDVYESARLRREIIDEGIEVFNRIGKIQAPQIFKRLDEFAKEKTTQTFANVAFDSYKKFGDKSPIISIENPPIGGAFSRGSELKEIVEEARNKFVERAVKEGMNEKQAKQAAEKVLGATWDVGHINMLKKYGFENKDIIKETEQIAPLVKHVHLSDNFGFEHTELPMGMGNVPIKEIMGKLGQEGYKGKEIIEALSWWQHFSEQGTIPPLQATLEAFGSPIYSMDMAPYWNQSMGLQQGYSLGLSGQWLPQVNYETFGGGFSQLPSELGGQRAGAQGSRMSGKPME